MEDVGISDKPLQSPCKALGAQNSPDLLRTLAGCGRRLPGAGERIPLFVGSSPTPISRLYLGLDVIQRKGNRDCFREGPGSSQTIALTS